MISRCLKCVLRASTKSVMLHKLPAKFMIPFPALRLFSSDPEKDKLFESVRYTVDTTGLDYMHSIKDSEQWGPKVIDNVKPVIVCFYATYALIY